VRAIAHISYGNSVCPSVCPSVTTQYLFKTSKDRDFGFSLYDSFLSLVFHDKILCHWVKVVSTYEGQNRGTPPKRTLFYRYWLV